MNIITSPRHSLGISIALHLLPGIAIVVAYVLITPVVHKAGWPSMTGMWLAALFVLVPLELGMLYWFGKKRNGTCSLDGIVLNRERTPTGQFILLAIMAILAAALCFQLLAPLDSALQRRFSWLPGWFFIVEDMTLYSRPIQLINCLGAFLVTSIFAPYVEELYFRGFLLPRICWMKNWAPLVGAFLFALYHFWSPWQLITRFLAVLPLVYIVAWKRDLRVGITVHWLLNTVGIIGLLIPLLC